MFRFLGLLMGVSIRTGSPLSLNLAEPMWKLVAGSGLTPSDITEIDKARLDLNQNLHYYALSTVLTLFISLLGLRERADVRARRGRRLQVVRGHGHAPILHHLGGRARSSGRIEQAFFVYRNSKRISCATKCDVLTEHTKLI